MSEKAKRQLTHEEELERAIQEIRERVVARYPTGLWSGIELPDFTPVLEARDQASAKVAAIGRVNPRRGGIVNSAIQAVKRAIARSLAWFVRDQIEFNHATVRSLDAVLEALNAINRTLKTIPPRFEPPLEEIRRETSELKDMRSHWIAWRREWEDKLARNEVQFLRAVADLENSYAQRSAVSEQRYIQLLDEKTSVQHKDFLIAMQRSNHELQERFWKEIEQGFEKVRREYEGIIYAELRALRYRPQNLSGPSRANSASEPGLDFDWVHFSQKFRGQPDKIRQHFRRYLPRFQDSQRVLDIGCGRGEFLEILREAGIAGIGIDLNEENVKLAREYGLDARAGDAFAFLEQEGPGSFDAIFCAQVIEHLSPGQVWSLVKACAAALSKGGVLVFETPNPECLAIFASHFFIDPSHTRPVPPALLAFYLEEVGFGRIEVERFAMATEEFPALLELPVSVREAFYGGLDYSIFARKLS